MDYFRISALIVASQKWHEFVKNQKWEAEKQNYRVTKNLMFFNLK